MANCKNCNTEITLKFCPSCGQAAYIHRIDGRYIIHEIEHVLHFERGILYTVKELFIRPGQTIKDYITENRSRLVKPIIFIIITSLIYTLVNHFFHIEEEYVNFSGLEKSTIGKMLKWVQDHYGYANIIMGAFIAWWLKVFFSKYRYNFFEILIMLCFVMGIGMLIFALFATLQGLMHINLMTTAGVVGLIYAAWAIGQFFDKKKVTSYLKAFIAYMFGMITFYILVMVVGVAIDLIIRH